MADYWRKYYGSAKGKAALKEGQKRYHRSEKGKVMLRRARLKKKYGISLEQYDAMLAKQGGVCAICGRPPGRRRLAVDHCHKTKRVRGLLCYKCNYGLGVFRDDPVRLAKASAYLTETTET